MIASAPLRAVLAEFMAKYGADRELDAWQLLAERMGYTNGCSAQGSIPRVLEREHVTSGRRDFDEIAWVDRFLVALDAPHVWQQLGLDQDDADLETIDEHDATCAECGRVVDWNDREDLAVRVELGEIVNTRRRWAWWTLCATCFATTAPARRPDCTGKTRGARIPDGDLVKLYRSYCTDRLSLTVLVEREGIVERYGYTSAAGAKASIANSWRSWGWPMYDRATAKLVSHRARRAEDVIGSRIPVADLRKLHVLHTKGEKLSALELARRTYEKYGYKSASTCHHGILNAWRTLGLKPRGRIEMAVEMSTKNGLSPRDHRERHRRRRAAGLTLRGKQFRTKCLGTLVKGGRCTRHATPSGYCWVHDPANAEKVAAHLEKMRARSPMHDPAHLEPWEPLRAELRAAYEWIGAWKPIADASGIDAGRLSQMAGDKKRQRIDRGKARHLRTAIAAALAPREQAV